MRSSALSAREAAAAVRAAAAFCKLAGLPGLAAVGEMRGQQPVWMAPDESTSLRLT